METTEARKVSQRRSLIGVLAVLAVFLVVREGMGSLGITLAGPLSTVVALPVIFLVVRAEGGGLKALGLARPASRMRALVMFLIAFAITLATGTLLLGFLTGVFGEIEPTGRFDYIHGNLWALLASTVGIAWFAAGFGEEVLMRGFVLPRLAAGMGGSQPAWLVAVLAQAVLFGGLHSSTIGAILAGVIGLGYGLVFWLGMRNVWPLVVAHAIPDTISLISVYAGIEH